MGGSTMSDCSPIRQIKTSAAMSRNQGLEGKHYRLHCPSHDCAPVRCMATMPDWQHVAPMALH